MGMNDLRAWIKTTFADATLATLVGSATHIRAGWVPSDADITAAIPAWLIYEVSQGPRAGDRMNAKQGGNISLMLHVWAKTEVLAWQILDRVETLIGGASRNVSSGTALLNVTNAGTQTLGNDPDLHCPHLVRTYMLTGVLEIS